MNADQYVSVVVDGLDEGFRVVCDNLNKVIALHYPSLQIESELPHKGDNLESARSKIRSHLPVLHRYDPLARICPWTLGYLNGPKNPPCHLPLVREMDDEISGPISFLKGVNWTLNTWIADITSPVREHHVAWKKWVIEPELVQPVSESPEIVLAKQWMKSIGTDRPIDSQIEFVQAILNLKNEALPTEIATELGGRWKGDPRKACNSRAKIINGKQLGFMIAEVRGYFKIVPRLQQIL